MTDAHIASQQYNAQSYFIPQYQTQNAQGAGFFQR
jgi:hypothetical protein